MLAALILIGVIAMLIAATILVLRFYPAFGGRPSEETRTRMLRSSQYKKGKFVNLIPTSMDMSMRDYLSILGEFVKGTPGAKPEKALAAEPVDPRSQQSPHLAKVSWFGHSALLLELDGKRLLFDPMLGRSPSPFSWAGGKRFSDKPPIEIEDLPAIDAVLFSHDHYDHLDYSSIMRLKEKVGHFFVPLGVGAHLERWGVAPDRIEEFDWWDEIVWEKLVLACTPARHFSGRGLMDRNRTLWCSWVILGRETRIFFSGDSGYGPHFKQIGDKYGPFDLTLMECGQYDKRWAAIHMMPEETVQAHLDVKGKVMIPIHWAAFKLALHDWRDPVERAVHKAKELQVKIATPRIGESVVIGVDTFPTSEWWRE
ncbi:L-ascorbate metabolism protein UlaG, beta-lactamase superfamily [Paenibacillus catalpae]|uniref:L-ascorbate metabolism protein UlaG, beta-lactamase superfamily n=1 Tax=Paenibacillus catalpae TaxID=1045775 RepID=A0A1I1UKI2_9BACL|nr:MBL fold metallo-hydrolase [Paenibacillus catalpae]SFD70138.1 L-ascorbate metabolism protein UlaG, beta-lactamase superfamily [Paenibacillus catalpae]